MENVQIVMKGKALEKKMLVLEKRKKNESSDITETSAVLSSISGLLQNLSPELGMSYSTIQQALITINDEVKRRLSDLKESIDFSEGVIQTIREPLAVLNNDMMFRTANRAFYDKFDLDPGETDGVNFYEIGNGQWDIPSLRNKLNDIIASNENFENFELTHEFKGIGKKNLMINATCIKQQDKSKNTYLIVIEDITEKQQSSELLQLSEERARVLIQNSFDIITIFSKEGDVIYESESIETVLGYKPEERIAKNIFKDRIVHPEDIHEKLNMFKRAVEQPNKDVRAEFRLMHKDGVYRMIEAVCINLLDKPGINGIVANYRDITERRMLEKQKEQFIGIASHELKTPVTSIKGYAQILQQLFEDSGNEEVVSLFNKMDNQIDRLTNLIKDLLDVTKISEGQLKLKLDEFDINELLNEIISETQRFSPRHLIVKELNASGRIIADREKIRQVIINLLSNAIKYSPHSDKIIVRSVSDGSTVTVSVEDFGIGIESSIQSKVFDRFFRDLDPAINTYPGLGLGLHIASEIVKRHAGKIWLTSEKNKGTTFYFQLALRDNGHKA